MLTFYLHEIVDATRKKENVLVYLPIKSIIGGHHQTFFEGCPKKVSLLGL